MCLTFTEQLKVGGQNLFDSPFGSFGSQTPVMVGIIQYSVKSWNHLFTCLILHETCFVRNIKKTGNKKDF